MTTSFMSGLFHSCPIGSDSLEFDRRSRPTELAADELWQPGNERGKKNIKWIVREFSFQERREWANSTLGWKMTPTCLPEGQLIPQLHTPAIESIKWFFLWSNFILTQSLSPLAPTLPNQTVLQRSHDSWANLIFLLDPHVTLKCYQTPETTDNRCSQ